MPKRAKPSAASGPEISDAIMQFKVWLLGLSPMVWRRVHVPADFTLRQLHGVIQVAMGWEGAHLFQFHLRAVRYGSPEVSARSPEATLESLRFRRGARFVYEYDLNVPWRHQISSAFVEATVNAVVSKRFAKKQQMQWTRRGAHLLLQTRTRALDGTLRSTFEHWFPGLANDNADRIIQGAAA